MLQRLLGVLWSVQRELRGPPTSDLYVSMSVHRPQGVTPAFLLEHDPVLVLRAFDHTHVAAHDGVSSSRPL